MTICDRIKEKGLTFSGGTCQLHWSFEYPVAFEESEEELLNILIDLRKQDFIYANP